MITVKQMRKILETVEDENQIICIESGSSAIFTMPFCQALAFPKIWIRDRSFECAFSREPESRTANPVCREVIRHEIK